MPTKTQSSVRIGAGNLVCATFLLRSADPPNVAHSTSQYGNFIVLATRATALRFFHQFHSSEFSKSLLRCCACRKSLEWIGLGNRMRNVWASALRNRNVAQVLGCVEVFTIEREVRNAG